MFSPASRITAADAQKDMWLRQADGGAFPESLAGLMDDSNGFSAVRFAKFERSAIFLIGSYLDRAKLIDLRSKVRLRVPRGTGWGR